MHWKTLKLLGTGAAIAAAMVLTGASPASAAGAGVTTGGSSTTVGDADPAFPLCLPATGVTITLSNTGTFNGGLAPVSTTAKFSAAQIFYFGPLGTFSDSMCTSPVAVTGVLSVRGGGVCDSNATYRRVTNAYVIQSTTNSTCGALVFTGNQNPCLPVPTCGLDGQQEFTGAYAQA